jgi:hypothetical protein
MNSQIRDSTAQRSLHVSRDLVAVVRVLRERLHGYFRQTVWDVSIWARRARVGNRIVEVSQHHPGRRIVDIRQVPNQELEQNDT